MQTSFTTSQPPGEMSLASHHNCDLVINLEYKPKISKRANGFYTHLREALEPHAERSPSLIDFPAEPVGHFSYWIQEAEAGTREKGHRIDETRSILPSDSQDEETACERIEPTPYALDC